MLLLSVFTRPHVVAQLLGIFRELPPITLSETPPLGFVRFVDTNGHGDFLVQDDSAPAVYLFTSSGEFRAELSPENCYSEDVWSPIRAKFVSGGEIFLSNAGRSYRFDGSGGCISAMNRE